MFFAPFVFLYWIIFFVVIAFLVGMFEVGVISYAFRSLGVPPQDAFMLLFASLLGSFVNIPVTRITRNVPAHPEQMVRSFGVQYRVPAHLESHGSTVVAVNVGGAVVPISLSAWLLFGHPALLFPAAIGTAIVTFVVHRFARPVPGLGIATPMFIPPIVAAIVGILLGASAHHADAIAYISGVLGTLIGADLLNIGKISELGAPVASIGGAGTFDGIFLTGIVAVLLA